MTITYSCVANGRAVLAELALTGGSYQVPEGSAPRGSGRGVTSEDSGVGGPAPAPALTPRWELRVRHPGVRPGPARGRLAVISSHLQRDTTLRFFPLPRNNRQFSTHLVTT